MLVTKFKWSEVIWNPTTGCTSPGESAKHIWMTFWHSVKLHRSTFAFNNGVDRIRKLLVKC